MRIELPQVGESVTEGIIGRWLKQVGDHVEKYDPLVEVVTDKVTMEVPSPTSGVLSKILVQEGQTVPMGAAIAEMDVADEDEYAQAPDSPGASAEAGDQAFDRIGTLMKDVAPVGPTGSGGTVATSMREDAPQTRQRYSPAVQRLASEHGVDLSLVAGAGIGGRVTRKDVQAYVDARAAERENREEPPTRQEDQRLPLTPVRRMIAENMARSASQIPQAWTMVEVDVSGLVRLREDARAAFQEREGVKLTFLPFVLEAVAEALREHRLLNSTWDGDAIILRRRINIGVAVATTKGLVVPVVHDADRLSVAGLAKSIDDLATRARQGKLRVEDVREGTFTVNNTGALGSVAGKGLINPPQAAIINTEAIVKRPVVIGDAIAIRSMMNLCLTFDHRILDGAEAGAFINDVKRRLEAMGPGMGV